LYEKIGGMDEQFALDYNDVDLCLNMDKHGYKNILCSSITAKHLESATRKNRDVKEIKNDLIRLMNKYDIKVRDPYLYTPADRS
jgi:GT2 family glycosyltransferase